MSLHGTQLADFVTMIQEHAAHDFSQNLLRRSCHTRIVKQMALGILRLGVQAVGQPAHQRVLVETTLRFQQFHTSQDTAKLVLPTASGGQQLFEYEGALADFVLVPAQSAEVADGSQYC